VSIRSTHGDGTACGVMDLIIFVRSTAVNIGKLVEDVRKEEKETATNADGARIWTGSAWAGGSWVPDVHDLGSASFIGLVLLWVQGDRFAFERGWGWWVGDSENTVGNSSQVRIWIEAEWRGGGDLLGQDVSHYHFVRNGEE
jgi:hypothetical protein